MVLKRLILILILFIIGSGDNSAQEQKAEVKRQFNQEAIANYKKDQAFDYERLGRHVELSPLERFQRWIDEMLWNSMNTREKRQNWRLGLYIFAALVITYVILRLLKVDVTQVFYQARSIKAKWQLEGIAENFEDIDFDQLRKKALQESDYNEALRWQYLGQLQRLNQQKVISWEKNKTNHDYWLELKIKELRQDFARLNRWFAYVHYGDFNLNAQDFQLAEADFKTFQNTLKKHGK